MKTPISQRRAKNNAKAYNDYFTANSQPRIKKTRHELDQMTGTELANHLEEITQTEICKDAAYCKMVVDTFMTKPLSS